VLCFGFLLLLLLVFLTWRELLLVVFSLERVSFLCINFEQPLVTRGKRLNLFVCEKGFGKHWSCSTEGGGLREKAED
jgi:hypothetical protein